MKLTKKENYYDLAGNQCSYRLSYNEVENELIIRLEDTEPCVVPSKVYESKFTLEQLQKLSKYFKMCDSITEAKTLILQIIEEKKCDVVNEKEKLKLIVPCMKKNYIFYNDIFQNAYDTGDLGIVTQMLFNHLWNIVLFDISYLEEPKKCRGLLF